MLTYLKSWQAANYSALAILTSGPIQHVWLGIAAITNLNNLLLCKKHKRHGRAFASVGTASQNMRSQVRRGSDKGDGPLRHDSPVASHA